MATTPLETEDTHEASKRESLLRTFNVIATKPVGGERRAQSALTLLNIVALLTIAVCLGTAPAVFSIVGVVALMVFVISLR